jgi:SMI1 / KNR4 family (SUKH-1)
MDRQQLIDHLGAISAALVKLGFDVQSNVVEDVATEEEVAAVEWDLGFRLPSSFRSVFLEVSREVDFRWFSPQGYMFPEPFQLMFRGDLNWSLRDLAERVDRANHMAELCFSDPDDSYDEAAFFAVGNGDMIAVDLAENAYGRVVYLARDLFRGHGHELAANFNDLLDRWVPVACAGGDAWLWKPFTNDYQTRIEPHGEAAVAWRRLLGVTLP